MKGGQSRVCRAKGCEHTNVGGLRMCPEHHADELERLALKRSEQLRTAKTRAGKGGPVRVTVDTEAIRRALASAGPEGMHISDLAHLVDDSEYRVRESCEAMGIQKLRRGRRVYLVGS